MRARRNRWAFPCIAAANVIGVAVPKFLSETARGDTLVSYEQNADGQHYSYADGTQGFFPVNNNWSQELTLNEKGDEIAPRGR